MKFAPLMLLPFLVSPVQAESIGDRSNRQAYSLFGTSSSSVPMEYRNGYRKEDWWKRFDPAYQTSYRDYQRGYSTERTCTRKEYREEYVPGTSYRPGYVKSWHDEVEVPCNPRPRRPIYQREPSPDGNECSEGAILGGILGGGAAAAISQGDGRWWAIPLGIVSGSVIGCDIDGG
tara:strand:- start:568 stop:1092 length:525 start_codon:yes stop_codon:yes gene_type:complete